MAIEKFIISIIFSLASFTFSIVVAGIQHIVSNEF